MDCYVASSVLSGCNLSVFNCSSGERIRQNFRFGWQADQEECVVYEPHQHHSIGYPWRRRIP